MNKIVKIKVTEKYHKEMQDKIISELRQKLAANEEYIKELEEIPANERYLKLKNEYKTINKKYTDYLNDPEIPISKYRKTISELRNQVKVLTDARDTLLAKVLKYEAQLCSQ